MACWSLESLPWSAVLNSDALENGAWQGDLQPSFTPLSSSRHLGIAVQTSAMVRYLEKSDKGS